MFTEPHIDLVKSILGLTPLIFYRALLYGGLGVEISSAILSSVYPPGVAHGADGVLLQAHSAAVNRSIGATIEARSCFGQFLKEQQVEFSNNTVLTAMLSVSSVRFALQVCLSNDKDV